MFDPGHEDPRRQRQPAARVGGLGGHAEQVDEKTEELVLVLGLLGGHVLDQRAGHRPRQNRPLFFAEALHGDGVEVFHEHGGEEFAVTAAHAYRAHRAHPRSVLWQRHLEPVVDPGVSAARIVVAIDGAARHSPTVVAAIALENRQVDLLLALLGDQPGLDEDDDRAAQGSARATGTDFGVAFDNGLDVPLEPEEGRHSHEVVLQRRRHRGAEIGPVGPVPLLGVLVRHVGVVPLAGRFEEQTGHVLDQGVVPVAQLVFGLGSEISQPQVGLAALDHGLFGLAEMVVVERSVVVDENPFELLARIRPDRVVREQGRYFTGKRTGVELVDQALSGLELLVRRDVLALVMENQPPFQQVEEPVRGPGRFLELGQGPIVVTALQLRQRRPHRAGVPRRTADPKQQGQDPETQAEGARAPRPGAGRVFGRWRVAHGVVHGVVHGVDGYLAQLQ